MLAQMNEIFAETCDAVFMMNQDDRVRNWCDLVEKSKMVERTYEVKLKTVAAERDSAIAELERVKARLAAIEKKEAN